jgi:hypothetical protein
VSTHIAVSEFDSLCCGDEGGVVFNEFSDTIVVRSADDLSEKVGTNKVGEFRAVDVIGDPCNLGVGDEVFGGDSDASDEDGDEDDGGDNLDGDGDKDGDGDDGDDDEEEDEDEDDK